MRCAPLSRSLRNVPSSIVFVAHPRSLTLRNTLLRSRTCIPAQWVMAHPAGHHAALVRFHCMNSGSVSPDQAILKLRKEWDQLSDPDRATALAQIKKSRLSTREVAREVGHSEASLRRLLFLLHASAADLAGIRSGNISTNEVLRRAKARLQQKTAEKSANTERERKRQASHGARLIGNWLQQHGMVGDYGEQIVEEARRLMIQAHFDGALPYVNPPLILFRLRLSSSAASRSMPSVTTSSRPAGTANGWPAGLSSFFQIPMCAIWPSRLLSNNSTGCELSIRHYFCAARSLAPLRLCRPSRRLRRDNSCSLPRPHPRLPQEMETAQTMSRPHTVWDQRARTIWTHRPHGI